MKKLIKTVAVLMAAALAVGSLASCKMEAELGDRIPGWKGQKKGEAKSDPFTVEITVKKNPKYAVDQNVVWVGWAKENGEYISDETFKPAKVAGDKITKKFSENDLKYIDENGKEQVSKKVTLLLDNGLKGEKDNENKDCRGTVTLYDDKTTTITSDNWPQLVTQQGIVTIANDEPMKGVVGDNQQSYFYQVKGDEYGVSKEDFVGNYTVHELWILEEVPNVEKQYKTNEDLKYKHINIAPGSKDGTGTLDEKNGTKSFFVPAGNIVLSTRQNKRAESVDNPKITADDKLYITYWIGDYDKNGQRIKTYYTKDGEVEVKQNINGDIIEGTEPSEDKLKARLITKTQINKKNQEFWGTDPIDVKAHEKYAPTFKTYKMAPNKLKRSGDDFGMKSATGLELFEMSGKYTEQK